MFAGAYGRSSGRNALCGGPSPGRWATKGAAVAAAAGSGRAYRTRRVPTRREDQYGAFRDSSRTRPRELGAWTNSPAETTIPTWDAPGATVLKNTRSPGATASFEIGCPCAYCSETVRGT